ncbi:MAG: CDP-diacylglycerol--glycerol-3-phosphate 3-phosphatidyltransferase [Gammaproteobacteria bacterium]
MKHFINLLTLIRIFLAGIIFLLLTGTEGYLFALLLFVLAGATDYFDGFLARKYNLTSQLGEILDPIADKILVVFVLFGLSVNLTSYFIAFIASLIISREIWVGALRDFNSRNDQADATKVTFLAKIKTSIQLLTISIYLLGLTLNNMLLVLFGDMFLFLSLLITIYTGYIYTLHSFKKIIK